MPEESNERELYREIVASHERLMWVPEFASDLEAWQGCLGAAREIDGQIRKGFERSSRQNRRQVLWYLRQYRHATLDVSWLEERRWKARPSAFEFALGASDPTPAGLESLRRVPLADAATAKVAETMLRRVARAISELGYEAFFGDVCADDMSGGPFSPIGASAVDLLTPNRHVSATARSNVILGVANGHDQGQKGGWPAILETVLRRLEAHATGPAVAVVISEGWDAARFDAVFQERCQAWLDQGHWLVFLLVGSPGTQVQQIPLAFGTPVMAQTDEFPTRPRRLIGLEDE